MAWEPELFLKAQKITAAVVWAERITPSAVLVINKNGTKLVNVRNQDAVTKILDMIPDLADKFTGKKKEKEECSTEELEHILEQEGK